MDNYLYLVIIDAHIWDIFCLKQPFVENLGKFYFHNSYKIFHCPLMLFHNGDIDDLLLDYVE